jgi:hypothetical protein
MPGRNPSLKITMSQHEIDQHRQNADELGFHTVEQYLRVLTRPFADIPSAKINDAISAARRAGERPIKPPVSPR